VAAALARYRRAVLPHVHREMMGWSRVAASIPDTTLRGHALSALTDKAANVEAAAVLAVLAPRRARRKVIRTSTALQVAVDYLDSLGEDPGPDPLRDGLELHGALAAALNPADEPRNWYVHHSQRQDGGYLDRLVAACRDSAVALPSAEAVLPFARQAAIRCGEGQAYTHAVAVDPDQPLRKWATELSAPAGFEWWEVAAGASSSVAAHALLALAATPRMTRADAELVDAAYFPSIGALTVLLDDLEDREADSASGQHNYLRHYPSDAAAAERLEAIVALARESIAPLPHPVRHRAILAGILAFYLSARGTAATGTGDIRDRLLTTSGPVVRSLARILEKRTDG
jgi:tetraprenyl-beta-curcumene synthase